MDIELKQISWDEYLEISLNVPKLTGIPNYYTINPETNTCVVFPAPSDNLTIIVRTNSEHKYSKS